MRRFLRRLDRDRLAVDALMPRPLEMLAMVVPSMPDDLAISNKTLASVSVMAGMVWTPGHDKTTCSREDSDICTLSSLGLFVL